MSHRAPRPARAGSSARQHDGEACTPEGRRCLLDGDRPAMALDDAGHDGQAEAGPPRAAAGLVEPGEAVEPPEAIGDGDARAIVVHRQDPLVPVVPEAALDA